MTDQPDEDARLDAEIARLSKPGMRPDELAELLPEDLRSPYWRHQLNAYFAKELG